MARAVRSCEPPGPYGITSSIGFVGKSWAATGSAPAQSAMTTTPTTMVRIAYNGMPFLRVGDIRTRDARFARLPDSVPWGRDVDRVECRSQQVIAAGHGRATARVPV